MRWVKFAENPTCNMQAKTGPIGKCSAAVGTINHTEVATGRPAANCYCTVDGDASKINGRQPVQQRNKNFSIGTVCTFMSCTSNSEVRARAPERHLAMKPHNQGV